jgi:NADH-ubiquinone oxidoreductase chain 5
MALPLFILSLGSIFIGYLTKDMIIGVGTDFWGNALFTHPQNLTMLEAEFIPHYIKLTPVILSNLGAISAFILYKNFSTELYSMKKTDLGRGLYTFLNRKWFFDKVYNEFISQEVLSIGYNTTYKLVDRGLFEFLGPLGITRTVWQNGRLFTGMQTGFVYHYTFVMLAGLTGFIAIVGLWSTVSLYLDARLVVLFIASTAFIYSQYDTKN